MPANIKNKVVLIAGAGGSIGSELCRQVLSLEPKKLILLELSEYTLYKIEQELGELMVLLKQDIKLNESWDLSVILHYMISSLLMIASRRSITLPLISMFL